MSAAATGDSLSACHVEATIAAAHAAAQSLEETDWKTIAALYDLLLQVKPSPVVELQRAVALSELEGPERGLEELARIDNAWRLAGYRFYAVARAELSLRCHRPGDARDGRGGASQMRLTRRKAGSTSSHRGVELLNYPERSIPDSPVERRMSNGPNGHQVGGTRRRNRPARDAFLTALVWWVSFVVFRCAPVHQLHDSKYTMLLAENLLRHGDLDLARYDLPAADYHLRTLGAHRYYFFPIGSAVLSAPFVAAMHMHGLSAVRPNDF